MSLLDWIPPIFSNPTNKVMLMKLNELATQLSGLALQLDKATTEILTKIDDLEDALAATEIPEDALTALEALKVQARALDDVVPDVPAPDELT